MKAATAFVDYAGLRLGEAQALRWGSVDLARGAIRVERGWDAKVGEIEPKSQAARRTIPIVPTLRDLLVSHRLSAGRDQGFMFGTGDGPFSPRSVTDRADTAWRKAKLERITPHEARHICASIFIAAGLNAKAVSVLNGSQLDRDHLRRLRPLVRGVRGRGGRAGRRVPRGSARAGRGAGQVSGACPRERLTGAKTGASRRRAPPTKEPSPPG